MIFSCFLTFTPRRTVELHGHRLCFMSLRPRTDPENKRK
jgi:hypothetical protein